LDEFHIFFGLKASTKHAMQPTGCNLRNLEKTPYEIVTGNKPNLKYFGWVFDVSVFYTIKVFVCVTLKWKALRECILVMFQTLTLIELTRI
jgi:hypothetical protein